MQKGATGSKSPVSALSCKIYDQPMADLIAIVVLLVVFLAEVLTWIEHRAQ